MLRSLFGWCLKVVVVIWLVLLVLTGAKFAIKNTQEISVDLIFWQLPEASIGFVLCITLLMGVLFGVVTVVPALVISKARLRSLRSKLNKIENPSVPSGPKHLIDPSVK